MIDNDLKRVLRDISDSINLPVRYLYARLPGDIAPVRFWLPPRPGRYERRRKKQLRNLGFVVRIWSPSVEPVGSSGLWGAMAWALYDGFLEVLSGLHAS